MAYPASRHFSYLGQFGMLILFIGMGTVAGSVMSVLPLLGKINFHDLQNLSSAQLMSRIMKPENAGILRWSQVITSLFMLLIPPFLYARICHKQPLVHLGLHQKVQINQVVLVILIMTVSLPLVDYFEQITRMIPLPPKTMQYFQSLETDYDEQVSVIARMNNLGDYIISLIIVAFLPALFEEVLFRGAIQNFISRWTKLPILSIIITALLFSLVHVSYYGFLSRFALGFILGWFYYRTGNLWLNIIGHFFNNALAITAMFVISNPAEMMATSKTGGQHYYWIFSLICLILLYLLFVRFEKESEINLPGQEVSIEEYNSPGYEANMNTNSE